MVKVFGHRGTRGEGNPPENSLAAFKAAIDQGAHGIELDLFLTKDKKLVVFHDDDLERMTGIKGDIREKTLAELQAMRLLDTKGKPTDQFIPSYAQVLDMIEQERNKPGLSAENKERMKNFTVNTEIKGLGIASYVAEEMKARLDKGWTKDNFQVSSFDMESLREMKKSLPDIPRGALFEGPLGAPKAPWDITNEELAIQIAKNKDIEPESINLTLPSLMGNNGKAVEMIKAAGARPIAWTCDEKNPMIHNVVTLGAEDEAEFLLKHKIDIITDFTAQRITALKSMERGSAQR